MERKDKYDFLVEIGKAFDGKNGAVDCRGLHIGGKYLVNTEGCDFTGTVLYRCTPELPNLEAFQIGMSQGSNPFSDIHLEYDMDTIGQFTNFTFDNIAANKTWKLYHVEFSSSDVVDCVFSDMHLHNCGFFRVSFENTQLTLSEFTHSSFIQCNLENVNITSSEREWNVFTDYSAFSKTVLRNSKFKGLRFRSGFEFVDVNLEGVEFVDCNFESVEFHKTGFYDVKFIDCDFDDIGFYGCTYRGSLYGIPIHHFAVSESNIRRIDE